MKVRCDPVPATTPQTGHIRHRLALLVLAGLAVALVFVLRPTYPNYDTYYSLVWGDELARGDLPDYEVFRTPTPHPLATAAGALLSLLGPAADRAFVLISLVTFAGLLASVFGLVRLLFGTAVAALAVAVVLTRTDLWMFALRATVDVPFAALVLAAAALEVRRSRAGWPVLALLALAGLLRPEAWLLSGAYFAWMAVGAVPRARLVKLAALAALAPFLWLVSDLIVTGEPLYSLTSTREVAGDVERRRGLLDALGRIPSFAGGSERIVNVVAGGLGALLALVLLRRRAAVPAALGALGVVVFLVIAVAGLSVIPRYLLLPSLLLNAGVAVALLGFTRATDPRTRRAAMVVAGVAAVLVLVRAPAYVSDVEQLNDRALASRDQTQGLKAVLGHSAVVPTLSGSCRPVVTPNHSSVPVVRLETGLGERDVEAATSRRDPPRTGLLLISESFLFDPTFPGNPQRPPPEVEQRWINAPLPGFEPLVALEEWSALRRCP